MRVTEGANDGADQATPRIVHSSFMHMGQRPVRCVRWFPTCWICASERARESDTTRRGTRNSERIKRDIGAATSLRACCSGPVTA